MSSRIKANIFLHMTHVEEELNLMHLISLLATVLQKVILKALPDIQTIPTNTIRGGSANGPPL
jgi:hypothetical protein